MKDAASASLQLRVVKAVLVVETLIVAHAAADLVLAKVAAHRRVQEALARVRIAAVQAVS